MSDPITPGGPLQFVLGFFLIWALVLMMISLWGGWWSLSQYYSTKPHAVIKKWAFQSASMRMMTGYGNCLNIAVTDTGLFLSILFIFRIGHSPLLIPWDDISVENHQSLFRKGLKLSFNKVPHVPLYINYALANKINEELGGKWNRLL